MKNLDVLSETAERIHRAGAYTGTDANNKLKKSIEGEDKEKADKVEFKKSVSDSDLEQKMYSCYGI